ncbi:cupin domain-containing protein [Neoroseomonas oryzicola]|uniref:Cupin domain-containing protein n=1 Tax=Neoroseomonas oryzicola TaxID=535904 RepID=A0A9X9WEF1_9PROT|nr:hypothetical protein [Neoroseomonas oryzicola]MBR0658711.1 hypothetical protein [Neoroseomonas oryzicola]NKE17853.1 hypothetical protein [Neoroseomonas oryzicola]
MSDSFRIRRHADGALNLGHHRRCAARLRRLAQRRVWRAAGAALRGAAGTWPRRLGLVALALLLGGSALAEPPSSHRTELLELVALPDGRIFRLTALQIGAGTETAAHAIPGEALLLVLEGTITRDTGDGEPRRYGPGGSFDGAAMQVLRNAEAAPARLLVGQIAPPGEVPARPADLAELFTTGH